ncbi:MAG: hypothetical protein JO219_09670 [Candidatus Eremiobacteraeota bacterium]|nr:hypothetical protein [Candidatus Eremiobacteraeota bacterium]MBV8366344.1 hypothetical protein [Candidatus Eremiobacteraeota bacterium]
MIGPVNALDPIRPAVVIETDAQRPASAASSFAALLDGAVAALQRADVTAQQVALGQGSIADASVARAKADVALEVAAISAARVSAAVNALLQTQV